MATKTQIGKLAVRRSIEINATPERVWQEFASEERMAFWFSDKGGVPMGNQHLTYEPRVGGIFQTEGMHEGVTPFLFTGKVLVFDPPRELTAEMGMVRMGDDPDPWP
ncbi:MAG: SRPBCC domain-containing protein, partial [Chloroflexota bacterium]